MRVQVNDRHNLLSDAGMEQAERKLAAALSKFGFRINRAMLTVQDNNGPRGGCDMECQVLVKLKGLGDVYASVKDETLSQAIAKAIHSTQRAVSRRIRKSDPLARGRRAGVGFVLN